VSDEAAVHRYRATFESWQVVDLNMSIAESAARLRASLGLRTADAIQAASALEINAAALVTHDRDFARMRSLRVIS
jgi:predicted nucleic acid-binding protein